MSELDLSRGQIPIDLGIPELKGIDPRKIPKLDTDIARSWGFAFPDIGAVNAYRNMVGDGKDDAYRKRAIESIERTIGSIKKEIARKGLTMEDFQGDPSLKLTEDLAVDFDGTILVRSPHSQAQEPSQSPPKPEESQREIDPSAVLEAVDNAPDNQQETSQTTDVKQASAGVAKVSSAENQVNESHADQIKHSMGEMVDALTSKMQPDDSSSQSIDELVEYFRAKSDLKEDDKLTIQMGNRKIYNGEKEGADRYKPLTAAEREKVNALLKGQEIKGSLRVYVNGEEKPSFQLKAGKETRNSINFQYPKQVEQKAEVKPPSEAMSLAEQIEALKAELTATREALQSTNQRLAAVESRQVELANPRLSQWLQSVKQQYQGHLQQRKTSFSQKIEATKQAISAKIAQGKQAVTDKVDQGKQAVSNKVDQGKQAVTQKVDQGKQAVADRIDQSKQAIASKVDEGRQAVTQAWMSKVVEPSLKKLVDKYGSQMDDGAKVLKTKEYQITQRGNGIHIMRQDGSPVTPENLNGRDQMVLTALSDKADKIGVSQDKKLTAPKIKAVKPKL